MRIVALAVLGHGAVARAFIRLVTSRDAWWAGREGFSFRLLALVDEGRAGPPPTEELLSLLGMDAGIVIDASPGWRTNDLLVAAIRRGHAAVVANDEALLGDAASFRVMTADRRARCEASIAGGLPVASAIESALDGADAIRAVEVDLGPMGPPLLGNPERPVPQRLEAQALILARLLGADLRPEAVRLSSCAGGWEASAGTVCVRGAEPRDASPSKPSRGVRVTLITELHRDPPFVICGPDPSPERLAAAMLRDVLVLAREEDKPWRVARRAPLSPTVAKP